MSPTRLLIIMVVFFAAMALVGRASATPYAIAGDSLSSGSSGWPSLAFAPEDMTNKAVGGASTYDFIAWCENLPTICWAKTGDADTIWWLMIGHNDLPYASLNGLPAPTGEEYAGRLVQMADLIENGTGAADIRLISSPYSHTIFGLDRTDARAWQDEMALADLVLCAADPRFTCVLDLRAHLLWPEDYVPDGLHLSVAGKEKVAALVPEPSTGLMLLAGLLTLGVLRKNRKKASGLG